MAFDRNAFFTDVEAQYFQGRHLMNLDLFYAVADSRVKVPALKRAIQSTADATELIRNVSTHTELVRPEISGAMLRAINCGSPVFDGFRQDFVAIHGDYRTGHHDIFRAAEDLQLAFGRHSTTLPITRQLGELNPAVQLNCLVKQAERMGIDTTGAESGDFEETLHGPLTSIVGKLITTMTSPLEQPLKKNTKDLLQSLWKFSPDTFTHSVDVAFGYGYPKFPFEKGAYYTHTLPRLLHDVGKFLTAVTFFPRKLFSNELVQAQKHPLFSFFILEKLGFPDDTLDLAITHHEQWNGKGYPFGLKIGELMSQKHSKSLLQQPIFKALDAISAMALHRGYQAPLDKGEILDEIRRDVKKGIIPMDVLYWLQLSGDDISINPQ